MQLIFIWLLLILPSALGSVLYLFGGSNYPESEECLEGLYAYDIGKTLLQYFKIVKALTILNSE